MENNNSLDKIREIGWASMHKILDHEMPRKKERKRMFVFFLPIGMLGLFVMVFLSYNHLSPVVSNSVNPLPKYTPFINKKIDTKPIAEVLNNKNELGLIHTDKILGKESLKEAANSAKFHGAKGFKELWPNGHSTVPEYVSTDFLTSTEQKSAQSLEVKDLELLNNNARDKVTILQLLPIYVSPITYYENMPNPELAIKPFNTSFHFGMLTSLASADFKEISNFYVGMHTNKSISNRWALTGQLGLRTYIKSNFYLQNKAGDNNLETNLSKDFFVENKSLTEDELNVFNTTLINEITNKVIYVESQIGAKYAIYKQLKIAGGMSVSRFLNEDIKINSDAQMLYASINQTSLPSMNMNELSNDKINNIKPLHKKWLFGFNFGAETAIFHHINLFSNFNYNITKQSTSLQDKSELSGSPYALQIQNSNIDADRKYNIELGVKYYFK